MSEQTDQIVEGKHRILNTAEALFTERGYADVSIRDIATACGLTNAALYYHFPNKAELFKEVMLTHADELYRVVNEAGEGVDDPRVRLQRMLKAYTERVGKHQSSFLIARRSMPEQSARETVDLHHQLYHRAAQPFAEVLTDAQSRQLIRPQGELSYVALLIGMLHGAIKQASLSGNPVVTDAAIKEIVDLFWRGLTPRSANRDQE